MCGHRWAPFINNSNHHSKSNSYCVFILFGLFQCLPTFTIHKQLVYNLVDCQVLGISLWVSSKLSDGWPYFLAVSFFSHLRSRSLCSMFLFCSCVMPSAIIFPISVVLSEKGKVLVYITTLVKALFRSGQYGYTVYGNLYHNSDSLWFTFFFFNPTKMYLFWHIYHSLHLCSSCELLPESQMIW